MASDLNPKSPNVDLESKSLFSCKWHMEFKELNQMILAPLLNALKDAFKGGSLFWPKKEPHISFVCGAAPGTQGCFRDQFLSYHSELEENKQLVTISAENTFTNLIQYSSTPYNLAKLEELIASISDSVILFSESAGSLSELGYFSAITEIRNKTLVILHLENQGPSFVADGPAALISHESKFKPGRIIISPENPQSAFSTIMRSISPYLTEKSKRRKIPIQDSFKSYPARERFFIIQEITRILSPLKIEDLLFTIEKVFGKYDKNDIHQILSALMAIEGSIYISEEEWLIARTDTPTLEYNFNELRTLAYGLYSQNLKERTEVANNELS